MVKMTEERIVAEKKSVKSIHIVVLGADDCNRSGLVQSFLQAPIHHRRHSPTTPSGSQKRPKSYPPALNRSGSSSSRLVKINGSKYIVEITETTLANLTPSLAGQATGFVIAYSLHNHHALRDVKKTFSHVQKLKDAPVLFLGLDVPSEEPRPIQPSLDYHISSKQSLFAECELSDSQGLLDAFGTLIRLIGFHERQLKESSSFWKKLLKRRSSMQTTKIDLL